MPDSMSATQPSDRSDVPRPRKSLGDMTGTISNLEGQPAEVRAERLNFVQRLARFGLGDRPSPLLARLLFPEPRK